MKKLLRSVFIGWLAIIAVALLFTALNGCAARRDGCPAQNGMQKHDARPFRVHRIKHHKDGTATVYAHHYNIPLEQRYFCLPDSVKLGSYITKFNFFSADSTVGYIINTRSN